MAYNIVTPFEGPYSSRSQYYTQEATEPVHRYGSLSAWQGNTYFEKFKLDAALLKEALFPDAGRPDTTVADQVFGSQARQQKIGLGHTANVLYERALLHKKHLRDIDRRLTDCLDRLSVMKMHFPLDGGRPQQHLEKLILALEKQRREEELTFWNDTAELRDKLFEGASTYTAARHRYSVFSKVEGDHD